MLTLETREETTPRPRNHPGHSWQVPTSDRPSVPRRAPARPPARRSTELVRPDAGPAVEAAPGGCPSPAAEDERSVAVSVSASPVDLNPSAVPYLPSGSPNLVDGLQLYLREAGRSQLLTAEDEIRLAQEIEAGREAKAKLESGQYAETDPSLRSEPALNEVKGQALAELMAAVDRGEMARQTLTGSNLRLVVSLARQHLGPDVEFADLIQEGNLGLMRAVDRFDWRKGNRFSTYALWWIRQAVSSAVAEHSRTIRLPSHMIDSLSRLSKAEQRLTQELGRHPTEHEVCQALGVSGAKLADLRQAFDRPCSLEAPVGEDGDGELVDMVEDRVMPTPLTAALASSLREQVDRVLATLDPREQMVISLRFGLSDDQPRTLEEVGRTLRITKERVRQIEARALRKLRNTSRSRWLIEFVE